MKPDFEKIKEYTKNISLRSEEKLDMFQNIRDYTNTHPVKTPYYSIFLKHSVVYAGIFALLIGTSATSFAAERALPGDILYPVKTEINEQIAKTLSLTKSKKAKTNVKLVEKRMSELTELVVKQKDSPEKIDLVAEKLEQHREELVDFIEEIEDTNDEKSTEAVEIYTELESVVEAHIDILEEIKEDAKAQHTFTNLIEDITDTIEEDASNNPKQEVQTLEETSLKETPTKSSEIEEGLLGEEDALLEIVNFSAKLEPTITTAKSKIKDLDNSTSTRIKANVRKEIIEETEEKLNIELDAETNLEEDTENTIQLEAKE